MTKDLEDDLHNIFSAIFSGRNVDKTFVEDFRNTVNILQGYNQLMMLKYNGNLFVDRKVIDIINEVLKADERFLFEDIDERNIIFKIKKPTSWFLISKPLELLDENSADEIIKSLTRNFGTDNESSS